MKNKTRATILLSSFPFLFGKHEGYWCLNRTSKREDLHLSGLPSRLQRVFGEADGAALEPQIRLGILVRRSRTVVRVGCLPWESGGAEGRAGTSVWSWKGVGIVAGRER